MVIGSGNIVHNLHTYAWGDHGVQVFDWAVRFEKQVQEFILKGHKSKLLRISGRHRNICLTPTSAFFKHVRGETCQVAQLILMTLSPPNVFSSLPVQSCYNCPKNNRKGSSILPTVNDFGLKDNNSGNSRQWGVQWTSRKQEIASKHALWGQILNPATAPLCLLTI